MISKGLTYLNHWKLGTPPQELQNWIHSEIAHLRELKISNFTVHTCLPIPRKLVEQYYCLFDLALFCITLVYKTCTHQCITCLKWKWWRRTKRWHISNYTKTSGPAHSCSRALSEVQVPTWKIQQLGVNPKPGYILKFQVIIIILWPNRASHHTYLPTVPFLIFLSANTVH